MNIPQTGKKKALIIVDVQKGFLNARNEYIVANILELLKTTPYDLYVAATFHTGKDSLWEKQQDWTCPPEQCGYTVQEIADAIEAHEHIFVEKETKSVFHGDKDLRALLHERGIEEVHIVGLDTNDCVLASAYDAFDYGFFTYVIEECCQASQSDELHQKALALLREQNMTNNSVVRNEA